MNLNKVFLIGRLTRNPESKALPSGQLVVNFGMATDRIFTDKSGQKQQQTDFHNIVVFGRLAEIASQFLTKGSLVMIEGRLRTRSWQGQDGQSRSRTEIIAERLQLGPKSVDKTQSSETPPVEASQEEIPIIEEEIDLKDIPF